MFELNGTYVIFIASFLVFMWLLNEIMLKPVGEVMERRAGKIQEHLEAGKAARSQAEATLTKYEQDLRHIRSQAQDVINSAMEDSSKLRQGELGKVAEAGRAELEKAKTALASERTNLIDALVAQERELIETITRKVLNDDTVRVSVDDKEVRRTLEETR